MLLQSHAGCLDLLPSLPDAWAKGSIKGLCARGNFGVDLAWDGGKLTQARITANVGGMCHIRYGKLKLSLRTEKGKTYTVSVKNGALIAE